MKSYASGPVLDLLDRTIADCARLSAERRPHTGAIVSRHQKLRCTYAELWQNAQRTARGLWALGIRPGDRVGMWSSSCAEWVYLQIATSLTGSVLVNVNPAYRAHELAYVLRKSRMKVIFLHERDARAEYAAILREARSGDPPPALEHAILLQSPQWDDFLARGVDYPEQPGDPQAVVNIQYTSGTTGSPKGVLLTNHNLVNNAYLVGRGLKMTDDDILCAPVPLYHCFGCVMSSLMCIVFAVPLVLPNATFDALSTLQSIHEERCTIIHGVPTMFIAELSQPDFANYDMSSLRTGIMAGAPCPVEVMRKVIEQMHCAGMVVAYGQTEASPAITMSSPDDSIEVRTSSIGAAMPNTEVKIIAPWNNEEQPAGEPGELCARGYMVMKGYDGEPEATARTVDPDGWLHTGDLATMDETGNFHIRGRLKEMIIRGGENIYPREIEEFLHRHPKIADVYIVGIPDMKLGETVLAWVKLNPGEQMDAEELRAYCRDKIAHFKVPQYVRFVDSFPMTVTGKVQKFRIRQQEIEALGLHEAAGIRTA